MESAFTAADGLLDHVPWAALRFHVNFREVLANDADAKELDAAETSEGRRRISLVIAEGGAAFAKGHYTTSALGLRLGYPYCDSALSDWVYRNVPQDNLIDRNGHNKPLVREHIARRFGTLPYVKAKGCFRFDLRGLARERFDQVHAFAVEASDLLPGAPGWLETHRGRLDNKFFASKFYLLAVTLPWLLSRMKPPLPLDKAGVASGERTTT